MMNSDLTAYVSKRVKEAKLNYGIKSTEIAEKIGLPATALYSLNSTARRVSYGRLKNILTAVNQLEEEAREIGYGAK